MSTQQKMRGGTTAQHATFTGAAREVTIDTDRKAPVVHDGIRVGGFPVPNFDEVQKQAFTAASATGVGANAAVIDLLVEPLAMSSFLSVKFKANAANTGSCTADIGLGAYTIKKMTPAGLSNLAANDLITDGVYTITFNGTYWILEGGPGGLTTVKQGDLSTSTGTVSNTPGATTWGTILTLPGGQYGFYPQNKVSNSDSDYAVAIRGYNSGNAGNTSYSTTVNVYTEFASRQVDVIQRYITSSPPFDMGDGAASGFIFALVDGTGEVKAHYAADVPPWAYNGPTNIRCDWQCPVSNKKYKRILKQKCLEEILDLGKDMNPEYELQEITQTIKNADMDIIPHPFGGVPTGYHVVLLDPMSDKIGRMIEYQNAGGDSEVIEAITQGHIKIDNATLRRSGPPGVAIHSFKYKNTRK